MKKNVTTGLLAAALVLGALPTTALAAETPHSGLLIAARPENTLIAPKPAE